jgi:CRP/FNR family transcriptional regulator
MIEEKIKLAYSYLFEDDLLKEISLYGTIRTFPEQNTLLDVGDKITQMPLLLNGAVKIMREDEQGDELLLYYLESGDTCAMTLTCCMGNSKSEIRAITEEKTEVIFIPVQKMDEWMVKYKSWRAFVLQSYHTRMQEMLEAIDALAFMKLDQRLYKYLTDKVKISGSLELEFTHQQIAEELNSSRVVISRLLKQLEKDDKIRLQRNKIVLLGY